MAPSKRATKSNCQKTKITPRHRRGVILSILEIRFDEQLEQFGVEQVPVRIERVVVRRDRIRAQDESLFEAEVLHRLDHGVARVAERIGDRRDARPEILFDGGDTCLQILSELILHVFRQEHGAPVFDVVHVMRMRPEISESARLHILQFSPWGEIQVLERLADVTGDDEQRGRDLLVFQHRERVLIDGMIDVIERDPHTFVRNRLPGAIAEQVVLRREVDAFLLEPRPHVSSRTRRTLSRRCH